MENIRETRLWFEGFGNQYPAPAGVNVRYEKIQDINCYWITPEAPEKDDLVIYLHGGSYFMGSIRSHGNMVSHFAAYLKKCFLFIEYSLAPENPYPQGIQDLLKIHRWAKLNSARKKIYWIGDSAGGGLIVSALHQLQEHNLAFPEATMLLSPWLDFQCNNPSYTANDPFDVIHQEHLISAREEYLAGKLIEKVNPQDLSFTMFPPTLFLAGAKEILLDDSIHFFRQIKAIQPQCHLAIFKEQTHVWMLTGIHTLESQNAMGLMKNFLENKYVVLDQPLHTSL